MDDRRFALLRRDLQDQWEIIDRVCAKIADRSVGASASAAMALRQDIREAMDRFLVRLRSG